MRVIGIDPGKSGGLAVIDPTYCSIFAMKKTEREVADWLREAGRHPHRFAYIEKVGAMPGQGVTSMFSFGQSYGFLRGCLISLGIPFEEVTPAKWQREFSLLKKKGETNTQKKNRHKAKAQQLFPGLKITHATADALLIMEWGRRQRCKSETTSPAAS